MSESWFWGKLKDNLNLEFLKRVENKLEPGWPDVHYSNDGYSGWIELKFEKKLPNRIRFEPGQPIWLANYWSSGGTCFVFLYVEETNEIYVWLGFNAPELNDAGGPRNIPPFMKVRMDARGWAELYQIFSKERGNLEFLH